MPRASSQPSPGRRAWRESGRSFSATPTAGPFTKERRKSVFSERSSRSSVAHSSREPEKSSEKRARHIASRRVPPSHSIAGAERRTETQSPRFRSGSGTFSQV